MKVTFFSIAGPITEIRIFILLLLSEELHTFLPIALVRKYLVLL